MSENVLDVLREVRLVPVIKLERVEDALPLADALLAGGMPIAEITFRTKAAAEAIRVVASQRPQMLVGAGTVLTIEQAQVAIESGASFIVSPGFNPELVDYCIERQIPIIPGVNSPTQVEMGLRKGLEVLKFFPAEASGGTAMLKALSSVYPVSFMPTGGISEKNIKDYLAIDAVIACGGTWMVKGELIASGQFEKITQLTASALEQLH